VVCRTETFGSAQAQPETGASRAPGPNFAGCRFRRLAINQALPGAARASHRNPCDLDAAITLAEEIDGAPGSRLQCVTWHSVVPRGLIALFGTLILSVAFALAIGHPQAMLGTWMLSFGFIWVAWVWLPERKVSRTQWWLTKTTQFAAVALALFVLALLIQAVASA
jgi:hypothetical protein